MSSISQVSVMCTLMGDRQERPSEVSVMSVDVQFQNDGRCTKCVTFESSSNVLSIRSKWTGLRSLVSLWVRYKYSDSMVIAMYNIYTWDASINYNTIMHTHNMQNLPWKADRTISFILFSIEKCKRLGINHSTYCFALLTPCYPCD